MKTRGILQQFSHRFGPSALLATDILNETTQEQTRTAKRSVSSPAPVFGRGGISSYLPLGVAVGAALAVTALLVRRAARRAEARHPATGQFVDVNGVRLHYLERGAGEPVVLLHGNGVRAQDFIGSGLADILARRYRVIALDRPGFGYSQRPRSRVWSPEAQAGLLQAAFGQLSLERPVVVAHSWGTLVALALALRHPDAARGLLLVSGYYYPTMRWDSVWLSPPAIPIVGDLLRYTVSPLLGRLVTPMQIRQMFAPEPVPAAFDREVPLEMMLRPWQLRAGAAEAALMMPGARSLAKQYGQLQLPVTLVAGTEDRIVDHQAHAARLHRELPHSRLLVLPGRGHMLHYTEAERLSAAVDELFAAQPTHASQPLPQDHPAAPHLLSR